ncbi:MAG TPA: EF-hand domain-containing protein [Azonexus sp.]
MNLKCKTSLATLMLLGALPFAASAADYSSPSGTPSQPQPQSQQQPGQGQDSTTPRGAQGPVGQDPAPLFKELDTNKDGYVSRDEGKRSAELTSRFSDLDTDRDGRIGNSEFKKGMQPKM